MLLGLVSACVGVHVLEMCPDCGRVPRGVLAFEMYPDRGRAPEVSLASSISIPTFLSRCLALTADSFLEVSLSDDRVSWDVDER